MSPLAPPVEPGYVAISGGYRERFREKADPVAALGVAGCLT